MVGALLDCRTAKGDGAPLFLGLTQAVLNSEFLLLKELGQFIWMGGNWGILDICSGDLLDGGYMLRWCWGKVL